MSEHAFEIFLWIARIIMALIGLGFLFILGDIDEWIDKRRNKKAP